MSEHKATVKWQLSEGEFLKGKYSRAHLWLFDGGLCVPASPSPAVVRVPYCDPAAVDPEEAFVASIASCHMLTFLYLASKSGFEVVSYQDEAVGFMSKNEKGVPWVSSVSLRPKIEYRGTITPTPEQLEQLHERAHTECFISNSVKSQITVQSVHGG